MSLGVLSYHSDNSWILVEQKLFHYFQLILCIIGLNPPLQTAFNGILPFCSSQVHILVKMPSATSYIGFTICSYQRAY